MPSDKHNSRTARARDLISSLINVDSSRDVHFHQPQQLHAVLGSWCYLCTPLISHSFFTTAICGRHVMASVRDIQIAEALLTLCLAYYVMKLVRNCWKRGIIMAFTYRDMGRAFHEYNILHVFRNGWMDYRDAFHGAFCLYCCVTDRT